MPYNKTHVSVKVPGRSGADKSHRNTGSMTCGTLTPLLCDEVIPNSRVSLKLNLTTQLPPLVSDTFMNVKLKAEAFFVPLRLCSGSFEDFFCDVPKDFIGAGSHTAILSSKMRIGRLRVDVSNLNPEDSSHVAMFNKYFGPGSLMDYLGCLSDLETTVEQQASPYIDINPMPLVAYGLIYQEWYRNPRVQKPLFVPEFDRSTTQAMAGRSMMSYPYVHVPVDKEGSASSPFFSATLRPTEGFGQLIPSDISGASCALLADGSTIFDLRQRNFPLDYFTGARVSAQQGEASKVEIELPEGEDSTSFTIAQLRAANSLQLFKERNNIPSPRMVDQIKARYNGNLSDGVSQRPICIGSATYELNSSGVSQTAGVSAGASNPFDSVGAQYGRAYGAGSDFIISDFTANEPGYIIVLASVVPEVTYSVLRNRAFERYKAVGSITDMACPLLQNVGDQPIYSYELTGKYILADSHIFGYTDRYADFMFIPNQVHGKLIEGQSLSSFVLQRSFSSSTVELNNSFLQIPKNYLDGVMVASQAISGFCCWYDSYLEYHVSHPLAEFSIPSLQDPAYEHGHTVSLRRNGQIF